MLEVVTDIPSYRVQRNKYPVTIQTWSGTSAQSLDLNAFIAAISYFNSLLADRIQKSDRICVVTGSGNGILLAAEFAVLSCGGILVPVHEGLPPEDAEQIISEAAPALVLYLEGSVPSFTIPENVRCALRAPDLLSQSGSQISRVLPSDLALIIYTSGSTGKPKGVMLTHGNVMSTVRSILPMLPIRHGQTVLSFLPTGHIFERVALYCYLCAGVHVHFADPRHAMALLKRVRPHYFTAVPRILDTALGRFVKAGDTRHYFVRSGMLWALETEPQQSQWLRRIARKLILRSFRKSYGGRLRAILVGGAALHPSTEHLFRDAGIKVRTGYGLSECCGVASANRFEPGGNRRGTVGMPLPGVEIRIHREPDAADGEILIRSAGVMQGYYLRPEESSVVLSPDGWLKTGDRGKWVDETFLQITGRSKEIFKNAFGEYVSPSRIERLLEHDPWINRALAFGSGRKATGALIVPDFETLEGWAAKSQVHWTAPLYMVHNTEVLSAFEKRIALINKHLPTHEQVRAFRLLHEPWTVLDGSLTPSLKLRRDVLEQRYKKLMDEMFQ